MVPSQPTRRVPHPPRGIALAVAAALLLGGASGQRQPPVLTAFHLNDGARTAATNDPLVATHRVSGPVPTDFRVSPRADFAGAPWQPYVPRPRLEGWAAHATTGCDAGPGSRRLRVFLQVRTALGDEVRIVNGQRVLMPTSAESNVLVDSICLVGTRPPA